MLAIYTYTQYIYTCVLVTNLIGKYLFIETSAPRHPGDEAVLQSATFPSTTGQCMQFWYNMYGATIGSLYVSVLSQGSNTPTKVWELSGAQGNQWLNGQVNIVSNSPYQVSFSVDDLCSFYLWMY